MSKILYKGVLVLCTVMMANVAGAQTLDKSVISGAGNVVTTADLSLEYTLGETVVGGNLQLNSGFNQGYNEDISAVEIIQPSLEVLVYPNPSDDELHVYTEHKATIRLVSIVGITVIEETTSEAGLVTDINTSNLASGVYTILVSDGITVSQSKWIKN